MSCCVGCSFVALVFAGEVCLGRLDMTGAQRFSGGGLHLDATINYTIAQPCPTAPCFLELIRSSVTV